MDYERAMRVALERARFGATASGDVPVGAVMLNKNGEIIALGNNQRELLRDPLGHAEMLQLRPLLDLWDHGDLRNALWL